MMERHYLVQIMVIQGNEANCLSLVNIGLISIEPLVNHVGCGGSGVRTHSYMSHCDWLTQSHKLPNWLLCYGMWGS